MTALDVNASTTASVRLIDATVGSEQASIVITTGAATVTLTGSLRTIYRLIIDIDHELARITRPGLDT